MSKKIRDIAVKVSEYQDQNGNKKGRWENVGALMKGDDGGEFIILQRWFNPAGIANPENRESVVLSCFPLENKSQQNSPPPQNQPNRGAYQQHSQPNGYQQARDNPNYQPNQYDDDLPL